MKKIKEITKRDFNPTSHIPPHTSENGITLIALVITIIVMLILVAVTITTAVNGGLFSYAGKATSEYKKAQIKEEVNTAWYVAQMESAINSYSNEEIAGILQNELRKNEAMTEVIWNGSENKYEVYYKGYKIAIDSNGKINESLEDIVKTELVLAIEEIQDTESIAKIATISIDGLPEMTDEIEKELETDFARQVSEKEGTNLTYEEISVAFTGEQLTLEEMVQFFGQFSPEIKNVGDLYEFFGLEAPEKYSVTIKTSNDKEYKMLAIKGNNIDIVLTEEISFQVESNKYTSNVLTQEFENNETYSTIYAQKTELQIDGYKVTVPAGFAVGESDTSIGSVSTGLVITDSVVAEDGKRYSNGNEFVWIPVETNTDGNPVVAGTDKVIAKLKDGSTTDYAGVLYEFTGTTSSLLTNTSYEEPVYIDDNYADSSSYNTVGITAEGLQAEYNAMITSIKQHGGFYVARYELSVENDKAVSKLGVLPVENSTLSGYNWYSMYGKIKEYSKESVEASMIWGSQYDAMLNFALLGNDKEKVTSSEYGNYTSYSMTLSHWKAGCTPTSDKINNIYDLAGNVREWTLEKYYNSSSYNDNGYTVSPGGKRVVRGGGYITSNANSANRYYVSPHSRRGLGDDDSDMGSRFTLYLK